MDAEENAQSEGNASGARLALTPPDEKRSEMVNECSSPLSPYKKGRYAETSQGESHREESERTPNQQSRNAKEPSFSGFTMKATIEMATSSDAAVTKKDPPQAPNKAPA